MPRIYWPFHIDFFLYQKQSLVSKVKIKKTLKRDDSHPRTEVRIHPSKLCKFCNTTDLVIMVDLENLVDMANLVNLVILMNLMILVKLVILVIW